MSEGITMLKSILFCTLIASLIAASLACNGCSIKKTIVKPCPGSEKSNVIKLQLHSLVLTSDCKVKPSATMNVTKPVKILDTKYQFQKGILKKSGTSDGCEDLEKAAKDKETGGFLSFMGLPDKCPLDKQSKKVNKETDVSKYKNNIHLLNGQSSGKIDISHGDKGNSCYTFEAIVECKKK